MRRFIFSRPGRGLVLAALLLKSPIVVGSTTLTICQESDFRAAVANGGTILLGCIDTIALSAPIEVLTNTVILGQGKKVTISGNDRTRLFNVHNGVSLTLSNLALVQGRSEQGGAIFNEGGALTIQEVSFVANRAVGRNGADGANGIISFGIGGMGGTPGSNGEGGSPAHGGAIYNLGSIFLTNATFLNNEAAAGHGGSGGQGTPAGVGGDGGAGYGGAIYHVSGTIAIGGLEAIGNQACAVAWRQGYAIQNGVRGGQGPDHGTSSRHIVSLKPPGPGGRGGNGEGGVIYNSGSLELALIDFYQNAAFGGGGGEGLDGSDDGNFGPGGEGGPGGIARGGALNSQQSLITSNNSWRENISGGGSGGPGGKGGAASSAGPGGMGGAGGPAFGGAVHSVANSSFVNSSWHQNRVVGGSGGNGGNGGTTSYGRTSPGGSGGNGADGTGGGLYHEGLGGGITNCTYASNSATGGLGGNAGTPSSGGTTNGLVGLAQGGAIATDTGTVVVVNTILASSLPAENAFGSLTDGGFNISSDESAHFTATGSLNNIDPLLGPLVYAAGFPPTLSLRAGSPAIDAADPVLCPGTDQRGLPRPVGPRCDIGAFELLPPPLFTTAPDLLRIEFILQPQRRFVVESSNNLIDWSIFRTRVSGPNGEVQFTDPGIDTIPWRFYRLRLVP